MNKHFNSVCNVKAMIKSPDLHPDANDKIIMSRTLLTTALKRLTKSKGIGIDGIPPLFWTSGVMLNRK